ncbi:hypothetical protein GCM10023115_20520 [Pontixanthobacter gangjinensis]
MPHYCPLAIVRQSLNDAVSRAAMHAAGEGIAIPAIARVTDLGLAGIANYKVRQDRSASFVSGYRSQAVKACCTPWIELPGRDRLDDCGCDRLGVEAGDKAFNCAVFAFDFDRYTAKRVAHPSGKPFIIGQSIDERSESHTLNAAADGQRKPGNW